MTASEPTDFDDLLDLGLATAFRSGGEVDESAAPPAVEVERFDDLPPRIGRYETRGLIAQGGMGVIVRAYDAELGREVAVKLLRRRLVEVATLQRMFQQEARVMGQLQHPGIVPVHDVGITSDGRPYYAMKLVAGESLQTMLRTGASPSERQELLAVFVRICETLAYAHSRGVVHGDLTPANVMVGAFGEVQVLDWGFARSGSGAVEDTPGSPRVLGTPAYMAPEQARGAPERLDPRVDVFGLGGILCALLTGEPPYRGGNREEVYLRAARAWLDDAQSRLAHSGADPQLLAIVRDCLSADPARRPADAGAVAALLRNHIAAVEQRLQNHALEAAQARARADAEHKARWRTAWLSGLVLVCVAVGLGIWIWAERREQLQRSDAEQRATMLMQRMESLRDSARSAVADRGERWSEVAAVAREAREVVDARRLTPAVRSRLNEVRDAVEAEAQQALRDERATHLLEDIDPHLGEDRSTDELTASYRALFATFGADVDSGAVATAAAALRGSAVLDHLIESLHRWARLRRQSGAAEAVWRRPIELADNLDRDPWRTELRRVWCSRDLAAMQGMADTCQYDKVSSESAAFLASCLIELGDRVRGLRVYRSACLHHPGEYELVHDLAAELQRDPAPDHREISGLMRAALALRPRSAHALIDLASELVYEDRLADARRLAERALALEPSYARAHVVLSSIADLEGDLDGAVRAAGEAARLQPNWVSAKLMFANGLHRQGKLSEALAECRDLVRRVPKSGRAVRALGTVLTETGHMREALEQLQLALQLEPDAEVHYHLGLAHQIVGADAEAIGAYQRAIELRPDYAEAHCNLGNGLVQLGRFDDALEALRKGDALGRARRKWPHPSTRWIELVESLRFAGPMVDSAVSGSAPTGASLGDLAGVALQLGRPQDALKLFRAIEAADARALAPYMNFAISAAARAAVHPASSAQEQAAAWRDCRGWLRSSVAAMKAAHEVHTLAIPTARKMLSRWQLSPELAVVREAAADAAEEWQAIWRQIAELQAMLHDLS